MKHRISDVLTSILALVGLIGTPSGVLADSWPPPHNTIFASVYGSHAVKVIVTRKSDSECARESAEKPQGERQFWYVNATLFKLNEKGEEIVTWAKPLPFIPHQVFVSEQQEVAGIDEYAHLGYRHALVVFSKQGDIIADYKLEDLLSDEEIKTRVTHTVSSRNWMINARVAFERAGFCVIRLEWGKVITVHLETGAIWGDFDPANYKTEEAFEEAARARSANGARGREPQRPEETP
jgi:hypothetical protein